MALNSIAHILAWKWKGDLESADCQFSYDGLKSQLEIFKADFEDLSTLYELHRKRVREQRERKKECKGE